jgi:hypothetical protein
LVVDHGRVVHRHELSNAEQELLSPLLSRSEHRGGQLFAHRLNRRWPNSQ